MPCRRSHYGGRYRWIPGPKPKPTATVRDLLHRALSHPQTTQEQRERILLGIRDLKTVMFEVGGLVQALNPESHEYECGRIAAFKAARYSLLIVFRQNQSWVHKDYVHPMSTRS